MRMLIERKKVILGRLEVLVKKDRFKIGLDKLTKTKNPVVIMKNELVVINEIGRKVTLFKILSVTTEIKLEERFRRDETQMIQMNRIEGKDDR